jgi:hypothetical protein
MRKDQVSLCVTSMHEGPHSRHPIELEFPPGLNDEERRRIHATLEEAVVRLGYTPIWIPVL